MISHTVRATSHETPASKLVNLPATDMPKLSSPPTHVTQQCLHTAWPEHQSLVTRLCNRLLPYTCACGSRIIHTPHICGLTQVVWSHHHCNTPCNGALEADSLTMSLPEGQELLLVGGWMQQQCAGLRQALFPRFFLLPQDHTRALGQSSEIRHPCAFLSCAQFRGLHPGRPPSHLHGAGLHFSRSCLVHVSCACAY